MNSIIRIQAVYFFITALWSLLDVDSFMMVTGFKNDIWLVKTVALLLIVFALSLEAHVRFSGNHVSLVIVSFGSSLALAVIDFYYALTGVISSVYLIDGAIESFFLTYWLVSIIRPVKKQPTTKT
jgi:hypothetical protein